MTTNGEKKFLAKFNCIRNHSSDEEDECPYAHHDKDAKNVQSFWDYILLAKETSKCTYGVDGERFGPDLSDKKLTFEQMLDAILASFKK
jgi:hypothetical protein